MLRDPSAMPQILHSISSVEANQPDSNSHWVDGPENQSEPSNGTEERSGLLILVLDDTTAVITELVDNDKVSNASHCVPTPFRAALNGERSEEAGQDHDEVGNDSDENVGTA